MMVPNPQCPSFPQCLPARLATMVLALTLVLSACSESATLTSENEALEDLAAADLQVLSGESQEGEVASYLPAPLAVKVVSAAGIPMAGVEVEWVFQAGRGVTAGAVGAGSTSTTLVSVTDASGTTAAAWQLGPRAGVQRASAQILIPGPTNTTGAAGAPPGHAKGKKVGFEANAKPGSLEMLDVTPDEASLRPGDQLAMTVAAFDAYGNELLGTAVRWRSSDPSVASVDDGGTVTAQATGTAMVVAKSANVEDTARINSVSDATSTLSAYRGQGQTGAVGERLSVAPTVKVQDAAGAPLSGISVSWQVQPGSGSVSAPITVTDADGLASTEWTLGTSTGSQKLQAAASGLPGATFNAEAQAGPAALVVLSPASAEVFVGGTLKLGAAATDAFGNPVKGSQVIWSVGDPSVLQVDGTGTVTGLSVGGSTVSATVDGSVGTAAITVQAAQTLPQGAYVEWQQESVTFSAAGQSAQPVALVKDASGTVLEGFALTYTSSNTAVVEVDEMGRLVSIGAGSAFVIAATMCCNVADSITVNVTVGDPSAEAFFADNFDTGRKGSDSGGFNWAYAGQEDGSVSVASGVGVNGTPGLRFRFNGIPDGRDSWVEQRFNFSQSRQIWVEYWIWIPDNYKHRSQPDTEHHKFFSLWGLDYAASNRPRVILELWRAGSDDISEFRFLQDMTGTSVGYQYGSRVPGISPTGPLYKGRWHRVRIFQDTGTPGNDDAAFKLMIEDRVVFDYKNMPNQDPGGRFYWEGGYLMGYTNGGFDEQTDFVIDNFSISSTDPGWW